MADIKILVYEPNKNGVVKIIPNKLKSMQDIVGGYIETTHMCSDVLIVCNEEGRLLNLTVNRCGIVGTFFIVDEQEDDFISLSDEKIMRLKKLFDKPAYINTDFEKALM